MERISDIKACSQRRKLTEEKSHVREAAPLYPHNVRIFPVKVKNERERRDHEMMNRLGVSKVQHWQKYVDLRG